MREIKFRAWDGEKMRNTFSVQSNGDGVLYSGDIMGSWEIMQFTGLLDKNDKEIYEGDVCNYLGIIGTIEWEQQACAFWFKWDEKSESGRVFHRYKELWVSFSDGEVFQNYYLEIIGNIYENPELLNA